MKVRTGAGKPADIGAVFGAARPIAGGGDPYGTHRVLSPKGALPQPAWRLDNDFSRLFSGEVLISVETLNLDAASFAQMEEEVASRAPPATETAPVGEGVEDAIAHIVLRTVVERGKQHNPVTGSGGMLCGRVIQVAGGLGAVDSSAARFDADASGAAKEDAGAPGVAGRGERLAVGDRVATLASLTLTPLRVDRVRTVRRGSAQLDVDGEAVLFASAPRAVLPDDLPERLVLAVLDVAGAAPQMTRLVRPGHVVVILGAGGKSGVLCAAEARRSGGASARVIGVESRSSSAEELRTLGFCNSVVTADARDPLAVRTAVLKETAGREADVTISCVSAPDVEMSAVLVTRQRGVVYFFAMSTSFTKAALGAEGAGKDIDLFIGNGYARGHAAHSLAMLREMPELRALFERRYGS